MRFWKIVLASAALLVAAGTGSAQTPATSPPPVAGVIPITGAADPRLAPLDDLMESFIRENHVPGAALAVARNGTLVYARGFGYADMDAKEPVQPESLFRIASISKPLTAAAVMRLVDQGKLSLDDRPFVVLGVKPFLKADQAADARLAAITVRDLLSHAGGWDRGASGDPMFKARLIAKDLGIESPPSREDIIRWVAGKPLDFDPGTKSVYSNFGYCVLGRMVEKAGGMSYEMYVQKEILAPLGATGMRIGRTLEADRAAGEVVYYSGEGLGMSVFGSGLVKNPYGAWDLEAMDAHGGWIASAPDLVRFGIGIGLPGGALSAESLAAMWGRPSYVDPKAAAYYAFGWVVRPVGASGMNTWHNGSLPGTSTLLVRRSDGMVWAVLFNTREGNPAGRIDGPLHRAVDSVKQWPGEKDPAPSDPHP